MERLGQVERLLDVNEAAELMQVSVYMVRAGIRSGRLNTIKHGAGEMLDRPNCIGSPASVSWSLPSAFEVAVSAHHPAIGLSPARKPVHDPAGSRGPQGYQSYPDYVDLRPSEYASIAPACKFGKGQERLR